MVGGFLFVAFDGLKQMKALFRWFLFLSFLKFLFPFNLARVDLSSFCHRYLRLSVLKALIPVFRF